MFISLLNIQKWKLKNQPSYMNTIINVQTPPKYTRVQTEWYTPSRDVSLYTS